MPVSLTVEPQGPPQKNGTRWLAKDSRSGRTFTVGQTVSFQDGDGSHRGLKQTLSEIPPLFYDRLEAEQTLGLWAHFIWPSVMGESGGHMLAVNTYDRARFTFGYYQLAAHTPGDNLILLFRALAALPMAADYFPDLLLRGGKLHRQLDGGQVSLEVVTSVTRPNGKVEDQILAFMNYLNPDTADAGELEALNTARLMHWFQRDRSARDTYTSTALAIMKRKLSRAAAKHGLRGADPRLAIWVSDILHQGRGNAASIDAALTLPTVEEKLAALFEIDKAGNFLARRRTIRARIAELTSEGRFRQVVLGDQSLPL